MKKVFSFLITLLGIIALIFTLSFLYLKGYFDGLINVITGNSTTQVVNSPNPNGMKYISERSFSLRFRNRTEYGFGTGWLFAKDNSTGNNGLTYYVATNLHVASFIQNSGQSIYTFDEQSNSYKAKTQSRFEALDIGQIGTWEGNNFIPGTNKAKLGAESTAYYEYFNLSSNTSVSPVTIAYESFDMFKNKNIINVDKIYGDSTVENGTLDLAILKIDFSKINSSPSIGSSVLKKSPTKEALKVFDSNPTRFSTKEFDPKKDVVTVGGFPAAQTLVGGATSNWNSASNTILYKEQDGARAISNLNWRDGISSETQNQYVKQNYSLKNLISYKKNEYASYLNVANQNLFYNMDLSGGSSGSMAINQNNEVVGIYWGTYTYNNGATYGVVDSFKNNKTTNTLIPYDLYTDFMAKIPMTGLKEQII